MTAQPKIRTLTREEMAATERSLRYCVVVVISPGLWDALFAPLITLHVEPPSVLDCHDQVSVPAGSSPEILVGLKGEVQLKAGEPAVIVPGVLGDNPSQVMITRP